MKKVIGVYGLGNFGFSMVNYLDYVLDFCEFDLLGYDIDVVTDVLIKTRKHPFLFKEHEISDNIQVLNDEKEFISQCDILVLALPSNILESKMQLIKENVKKDVIFLNLSKALTSCGRTFSLLFKDTITTKHEFAVLNGGMIAEDFFMGYPLGCTIASANKDIAKYLTNIFHSDRLFIEVSGDILGVEYAGALKNVGSILIGFLFGKGYPYGTVTYYITRFSEEIKKLVCSHLGGMEKTFTIESQCWGNDFFMSCTGNTRNRQFGELLGKGATFNDANKLMKDQGITVEGINTLKALDNILKSNNKYNYYLLRLCVNFMNDDFDLSQTSLI